jgi:flagellar assembly protein FliH
MATAAKFLFDEDFATGEKPTITIVEHDRRRQDAEAVAYRNGFAAAQAQAHAEADQRIAAALASMAETMERLGRGLDGVETRLEIEAVQVAVAVARKLAPALIALQPDAEITALVTDCFRQLVSAPHVTVRVPEAIHGATKQKIEETARSRAFEGRLTVIADATLAPGDCKVEWADGGINRDSNTTEAAIEEVVARYVTARAAETE